MSENFSEFQKNVCEPPEKEPIKRICPPCEPNPNYVEPNWRQMIGEPYFNEKTCEFQVAVTVNKFGDSFVVSPSNMFPSGDTPSGRTEKRKLLRSYVEAGIRLMLEEYGKLIADQIICAYHTGPALDMLPAEIITAYEDYDDAYAALALDPVMAAEDRVNACRDIDLPSSPLLNPEEPSEFSRTLIETSAKLPQIKNPLALEIYAYPKEWAIVEGEGGLLKVLVAIPSYILEKVPDNPTRDEIEKEATNLKSEVILTTEKLWGQITRLKSAMWVYSQYQSAFLQIQKGYLYVPIEESKISFYASTYSERMATLYTTLKDVASDNGWNIRSNTPSVIKQNARLLKITFDNSDPEKPYQVAKIEAKKKGCPYEEWTRGMSKLRKSPSGGSPFDATTWNYIAKLEEIDIALRSRKSYPWMDFLIKFTYPLLSVDYGRFSEKSLEEEGLQCISENIKNHAVELRDYILNESLSISDFIQYEYNKNSCTDFGDLSNEHEVKIPESERKKKKDSIKLAKQEAKQIAIEESRQEVSRLYDKIRALKSENIILQMKIDRFNSLESVDDPEFQSKWTSPTELASWLRGIEENKEKVKKLEKEVKRTERKTNNKEREYSRAAGKYVRNQHKGNKKPKEDPYWRVGYEAALQEFASQDTLLASVVDKATYLRKGGLNFGNMKEIDLVEIIKRMSVCNLKSLTIQSVRCLFSGVKVEDALTKIVKASLEAMDLDVFGIFIKNLPPQKQIELRKAFEKEFGDLPLPWEQGYDPGSIENTNLYIQYLKEAPPSNSEQDKEELEDEPDMELPGYTGVPESEVVATVDPEPPIEHPTEGELKEADKSWKGYIQRRINSGYSSGQPVKEKWYEFATLYWPARKAGLIKKSFPGVYKFKMDFPKDNNLLHYDNYVVWYNNTQAYLVEHAGRQRLMRREKTVEEIQKLIPLTKKAIADSEAALAKAEQEKVMAEAAKKAQEAADARAEAFRLEQEQMLADTQALIDARIEEREQYGYELSPGAMAVRDWGRRQQAKVGNSYVGRSTSRTAKSLSAEWAKLTDENRRKIIKNETDKDSPGGQQGTYGVALGNIQKLVVDAYIEHLLDIVGVDELMQILDRFPGSDVLFKFVGDYTCAFQGMFKPPVDSFLSTLSLDVCGDMGIGIGFPDKVKEIPAFFDKSALLVLKKQFAGKIEAILTEVIKRLILKVLEGIDSALCKGLNAVGTAAADLASGKTAGLDSIFAEAFCPDANEEDLQNTKKNVFKASGIVGSGITDENYNQLYKTLNTTLSKNDLIGLLTNTPKDMNAKVLTDLAQLTHTVHPELADVFGTPSQVAGVFGQAGNYIPPELRQALRDQANAEQETPLYDSVCLTQPELDAWNQERADIYENLGVDPDTARDLVDQANNKREEDIEDLLDYLEKGTDGILGDAVDSLLDPNRDPGCVNDKSALLFEDASLRQTKIEMIKSMFENIDRKFIGEIINNKNAILNNILRDKNNFRLKKHERRADSPFFFPNYTNSPEDWEFRKENSNILISGRMEEIPILNPDPKPLGNYPMTVGVLMKSQMESYTSYLSNRSSDPGSQIQKQFINSTDGVPDYEFKLSFKLRKVAKPSYRLEVVETFRNKITEAEAERLGIDYGLFSQKSLPPMTSLDLEVNNNIKADKYMNFTYTENQDLPYQALIFKSLLESKVSGTIAMDDNALMKAFDKTNKLTLQCVQGAVTKTPSGDVPSGFRFGYQGGLPLTFEDLWYVNPDADPSNKSTWLYTHPPGDQVLGKSATENPRVHFLDPKIHGGNYLFPKIYVEPASYDGWLGMVRTFIPELKSCEEEDNGFLNITQLAKRVKEVEDNLPFDERLSLAADCRIEVPYDKHFSPASHGIMEGVVLSTMRVYCTEYIFKTLPVFSGIELSTKNVDNAFLDLIVDQLKMGLSSQTTSWNIVQGYVYYLMFLEQVVQTVQRQIQDGLMEETEEIKSAFTTINSAQQNYDPIKINIFDWESMPWDSIMDTFRGAAILAFGENYQEDYDSIITEEIMKTIGIAMIAGPAALTAAQGYALKTLLTRCAFLSPFKLRLARKINTLEETREAAETILRALAKNQLSLLMKKISLNMRPRPHVQDIQKYLLSRNGIVFGSTLRSGEMIIEQPTVEGSTGFDYGNIFDVVRNVETDNHFEGQEITITPQNLAVPLDFDDLQSYLSAGLLDINTAAIPEFLRQKISNMVTIFQDGLFYLEKYVRIYTKDGEEQVLSIPEFQEIIAMKLADFNPEAQVSEEQDFSLENLSLDPAKNISEFFGNAYLVEEEVKGTIGVKFGVRLIYNPPPQFNYSPPNDTEKERTYKLGVPEVSLKFDDSVKELLNQMPNSIKNLVTNFLNDNLVLEIENLSRAIPVVEFEQDIKDRPIGDLDLQDKNMGEELKCYIDHLVKEHDFKVLFDLCYPARSFVSFYGIYSFYAFFESIGKDISNPEEVDEDPARLREQWKQQVFEKTKKELRQLFNATYRTDDDEQEENEPRSKREKSEFLKNLLPQAFMNLDSSIQWWQRIRFVDIKPFDADGNECLNAFQKMFR